MKERLTEKIKFAIATGLALGGLGQQVSAAGETETYTVKPGDTLTEIAKIYPGVTWQEICGANRLPNCNLIHLGQKLIIPESETVLFQSAARTAEGKWEIQNADGEKQEIVLPEGFVPDARLKIHTQPDTFQRTLLLPKDTTAYADFQKALNTKQPDGTPPLAGYDPSIELGDYCSNPPNHQCTAQLNMFSWKVFTGEKINIPGIGLLTGKENRAVMVLLLNRDGSVHAWDGNSPVRVEHGFTGGGPLWDGERNVDKAEQGLAAHYADRLLYGIPGMYRGACDNPENCAELLAVSVQRRQWGNNPDGSPRRIFELIRAEIIRK